VRIEGIERMAGGASRETWVLTAGGERVVLRRDPPGHLVESSRRAEGTLLEAAAAAGVPVPRVRWLEEDPAVLGGAFLVMDFVPGETIGPRILRDPALADARAALPEQIAAAAARIHAMPPAVLGPATAADAAPAVAELVRYEGIYRQITPDPHPALELGLRWLAARAPARVRRTVVHGDFRLGNFIVGPEGLRAVLDWELAHVGDPMEDLGWLCVRAWRFGAEPPVGGLCERERLFAAYERAGGAPVDPAVVRWWEVFGNLKWAVICIVQAQTFLGGVKNVELASLGRRVAEVELELLDLTEA
jgi:aminoglycoside phosphotransferase (APT) family kinase protein